MSNQEYKLQGSEIVRVKDGKVVANIEDGKIIPVAPVYFKEEIFSKLEEAAGIKEKAPIEPEPISEDEPEPEPEPETPEQEEEPEPDLDEEEPSEIDLLAAEVEGIFNEGGFLAIAEVILNREKAARKESDKVQQSSIQSGESKVIDYREAPPMDRLKGDRTPEFRKIGRAHV